MGKTVANIIISLLLCLLAPLSAWAVYSDMNNFCVTPPFIQQSIAPNLLLLIDNSASMYDLAYQDTGNKYCANSPSTVCSADSTCSAAGAGTCVASVTVTAGTTSYSAKACTTNANCPNSPAKTATQKMACTTDAQCQAVSGNNGDKCKSGACNTATVTVTTQPCNSGYCNTCNTTTGVGDCISSTSAATYTPVPCTTDSTCNTITTGDTCNNKCSVTRQCYDTSYSSGSTYVGYFSSNDTYLYDVTNGKFTGGATMLSSCTYSALSGATRYLCVNTTGSGSSERLATDGTGFTASGNFLNWLTASKFDQEKQILTGGKFDTSNNVLVAESRGCSGRKFIKAVSGVNLTFAIRGGTPGGLSVTQNQATEYGPTYIDIQAGTYNATDCLNAMSDWMTVYTNPVNLGAFQNDTKGCVGAGNAAYNAVNVWNHILHDCYDGILGKAQGYATNLGPLEGECSAAYASGLLPSDITDPNSGISICSSVLSYTDSSGNAQTGYLGACYNSTANTFDSSCALTQMTNYCNLNVSTSPVLDPSSNLTGTSLTAPGFILEQGLMNTVLVGTMAVRVAATAPTGLIDQFKSNIRFGAMAFNNDGSGSECGVSGSNIPCSKYCSVTTTRLCFASSDCPSGETCGTITNKDSGRIISFVGAGACSVTTATSCDVDGECPSGEYCIPSVGNHSSGLIKALDDLQATTWTPHAEAFYNAIAYYVKDAAATNPALPSSFAASSASTSAARPINTPLLTASGTASDSYSNKNPIQYRCQQNNILIITDGASTADKNSAMVSKVTDASNNFRDPNTTGEAATCGNYAGSPYLHDLSYYAHNRNIFDPTKTCGSSNNCESAQTIRTYAVYTGATSTSTDVCDPYNQLNLTAANGGTTLYTAVNPAALRQSLNDAFLLVSASSASGTAASILSNSEGSGASLLQALFYPKKDFDKTLTTDTYPTSTQWIGELQDFWYFLDPNLQKTSIREDTNGDYKLNLINDKVVQFYFDGQQKKTLVNKYTDTNGDGAADSSTPDTGAAALSPDSIKSLWMAGRNLWNRNLTTSPRTIYTGFHSTAGNTPQKFSNLAVDGYLNTWTSVWDILNIPTATPSSGTVAANRQALATKLIDYVHGIDQANDSITPCLNSSCQYRPRKVTILSCGLSDAQGCTREWKLGDIISSTPRLVSNVKLNTYNLSSPTGYSDSSYNSFVNSSTYLNRGMAFVGANDGMLHAFKLGLMKELGGMYDKAQVTTSTGSTVAANLKAELGQEAWAYIPMNTLPYLQYLADPGYSHVYYVDKSPLIVDASIGVPTGCSAADYSGCTKSADGSTWRTILIGGTGIGGAGREQTAAHNAVKPPIADVGYSSYFALDITDPTSPKYLWEFIGNTSLFTVAPKLGFATTGPAIVRVATKVNATSTQPDHTKNGKWFAVFASGPLGPIDTVTHSFKGESDQRLRLFVVDLASGALLRTIDCYTEYGLGLDNAFGGSLASSTLDADRNNQASNGYYSDDVVYIGYVEKDTTTGTWTKGGVLRLTTKESTNPADWVVSKLIDGTGPVTTSATKLQDRGNNKLWVFFGSGRYYYKNDDYTASSQRQAVYGIKDPCYTSANTYDKACTTKVSDSIGTPVVDQSGSSAAPATTLPSNAAGWKILLDDKDTTNYFATERVITDPLASPNGAVFFTTFKPSSDLCQYGGNSLLWAVRYDTGSTPPANSMKGKALMQVSTGAFQEITLSTAFKNPGSTRYDGRRLATPITGVPPTAQGLSLFSNPMPIKKILHYQEK